MVPSGSAEALPLNATTSGLVPDDGVTVKLAVGDTFGAETVMVLVAVPVAPLLSVTVSVTV